MLFVVNGIGAYIKHNYQNSFPHFMVTSIFLFFLFTCVAFSILFLSIHSFVCFYIFFQKPYKRRPRVFSFFFVLFCLFVCFFHRYVSITYILCNTDVLCNTYVLCNTFYVKCLKYMNRYIFCVT